MGTYLVNCHLSMHRGGTPTRVSPLKVHIAVPGAAGTGTLLSSFLHFTFFPLIFFEGRERGS